MTEGKVVDGGVDFNEGKLVVHGSLNPNKDAEDLANGSISLNGAELLQEIFQRAKEGKAELVIFKPEFSGTKVAVKLSLDTDKDGEKVAELDLSLSLLEITDEAMDLLAAAKGKKLVSA